MKWGPTFQISKYNCRWGRSTSIIYHFENGKIIVIFLKKKSKMKGDIFEYYKWENSFKEWLSGYYTVKYLSKLDFIWPEYFHFQTKYENIWVFLLISLWKHFYTSWKRQKTCGLGEIKRNVYTFPYSVCKQE